MHKNTLTFYSRYTKGDKVAFKWNDRIIHGVVSSVDPDVVDGSVIPTYVVDECDITFRWGDREIDGIYERQIIED